MLLSTIAALVACSGANTAALDTTADPSSTANALTATTGSAITPMAASGLCLDVTWGSETNGTPVQIAKCTGNPAQSWTYVNGALQVFGNKCLDVPNGEAVNAALLQIWDCTAGAASQQWARNGNAFVFKDAQCMDLPGGRAASGTRVQIYGCGPADNINQQWGFSGATATASSTATAAAATANTRDSRYETALNAAMCMDVVGGVGNTGTPIQVATCSTNLAQVWTKTGGTLQSLGKCLDVEGPNLRAGALLQLGDCGMSNSQQWSWTGTNLQLTGTDLCVDIPGGNVSNGQRLQIWTCGGDNKNQVFRQSASTAARTGTQGTSNSTPVVTSSSSNTSTSTTPVSTTSGGSPASSGSVTPLGGSGKYTKLSWSDEFDGKILNAALWNYEVDCNGGYNGELQCYTNSANNLFLDGQGHMVIRLIKQGGLPNGKTYSSARINTLGNKSALYGRMEARVKIPSGKGLWPAFWTMPVSSIYGGWPTSGELDIMEILGEAPGKLYGSAHYGVASPYTQLQGIVDGADLSQDYHVYAMERDENQIRWYLDEKLYYTMNATDTNFWPPGYTPSDRTKWPYNQPFYAIFNLAVGGSWPVPPDTTLTSADLMVDYLRMFE